MLAGPGTRGRRKPAASIIQRTMERQWATCAHGQTNLNKRTCLGRKSLSSMSLMNPSQLCLPSILSMVFMQLWPVHSRSRSRKDHGVQQRQAQAWCRVCEAQARRDTSRSSRSPSHKVKRTSRDYIRFDTFLHIPSHLKLPPRRASAAWSKLSRSIKDVQHNI